jgi:hypothetical protein
VRDTILSVNCGCTDASSTDPEPVTVCLRCRVGWTEPTDSGRCEHARTWSSWQVEQQVWQQPHDRCMLQLVGLPAAQVAGMPIAPKPATVMQPPSSSDA